MFCMFQRGIISQGDVGFILSSALSITQALNWLVRKTSEVETNIVSVERIMEYNELSMESNQRSRNCKTRHGWPETGAISFHNLSLRYRSGQDLVLANLTCNIEGGSKVGIVGRTGAGKSSLTVALFRIVEAASGSIMIDDIDISTILLHELRSRITIIPQDPVIFSGSFRMNLDPFEEHSDEELWAALQLSHMDAYVREQGQGLQFTVSEGGGNLSLGQCQLVCLARALLR